jgi:glutathione S-transferase
MYGAKAHIAALEKGLAVNLVMVPFTDDHRYDPKHPEVLRINPKRQVPVLIHGAVEIFDSTQIFEYFEHLQPQPPLWPAAPAARAQARLLELKSDEVFFPHVIRLMGLQDRLEEPPAQEAIAQLHRYYGEMEALLTERDYLCGKYTYADIAFFMAQLFAARKGVPMAGTTPRLLDWRRRVAARPAVQPTLVQMIQTLTRQGHPVPQFMSDAVSARTA